MVATDLIRAAQFHHATGVWIAALPPLSLYQTGPVVTTLQKRSRHLQPSAICSNADIYFTCHSDRRSIQSQEEFRSDCFEKWTLASVSYEDCFLLEWCYKKCLWQAIFFEIFPVYGMYKMYKVVLKTGFSMTFPMGFLHEQPWWCLVMPGRVAFGASLRGLVRHFTDANTGIAIWWQDLPPPEKGAVFLREKSSLPSIKIFRCYVSFREVLFHDIWIFGYIGLPATWKVWVEWMETWKIETACLL